MPSRDFDATAAFYAKLGFRCAYRDPHWMILQNGSLEVEFFPYPDLDPRESWFSACIRVVDLDLLYVTFQKALISTEKDTIPRLTPPETRVGIPRMFALVDCDGSLLRCLEDGTPDGK